MVLNDLFKKIKAIVAFLTAFNQILMCPLVKHPLFRAFFYKFYKNLTVLLCGLLQQKLLYHYFSMRSDYYKLFYYSFCYFIVKGNWP